MNFCHQAMFYPRSVYKKYSYSLDYRWLADYVYNFKLMGDAVPFAYAEVVVSIFNDKGGSSQGDAAFEKRKISLIRSSLGTKYALIETLRRRKEKITWVSTTREVKAWVDQILLVVKTWVVKTRMGITWLVDKTVSAIGIVVKCLLPYSFWKYLQTMWRWLRKKY
jgi:hypothetical protein